MDLLKTTITIDGTAYNEAAQKAAGLVVTGWGWDLDDDSSATFSEEGPNIATPAEPSFVAGKTVAIAVNWGSGSTLVFSGEIAGVAPRFTNEGWSFDYRVRGWKYRARATQITATNGTGRMVFNAPPDDTQDWIPSLAGLTVGQIITDILTQHSTQLTALGITTDSTTTSQLAALTIVPIDIVIAIGPVFNAIDSILRTSAKNVASYVTPAGLVRFLDTTTGTAVTLTEGTDVVEPFRFSWDFSDTYTRVVVRGGPNVLPFFAKMSAGHLTKTWTTGGGSQEAAWTEANFTQPKNGFEVGALTTINSATSITITPTDPS